MALSNTAARALEQVKMGLYMLRGADYFSEEEWVKVDFVIHKGNYVFTNGPPKLAAVEQLISFDDNSNEKNDFSVRIPPNTLDSLREVPSVLDDSTPSSDPADSGDCLAETPNTTSAEVSSDDEPCNPHSITPSSAGNTIHQSESAETPKREPVQRPSNGGLAFYTQAQLDEVKAFNSGLTKAGQKSKPPKYNKYVEEPDSPTWSQNETSDPGAYPSPTASEQDTHSQIQTWATDVGSASPATETGAGAATTTTATAFQAIQFEICKQEPIPVQPRAFVPPTGTLPRPSTVRPSSRISHHSSKSAATPATPPGLNAAGSRFNVKPGTVLIAQRSFAKTSYVRLDVKVGDMIKYSKFVSGITHCGENLRTKERGQFDESIFKKGVESSTSAIQQQRSIVARNGGVNESSDKSGAYADGPARTFSLVSNGIDRVERSNAAEWDDVSSVSTGVNNGKVSKPTTTAPAPAVQPFPKPSQGLGGSMYAAEDDNAPLSEYQGMSKVEVGQLIDLKIAQIIAAQTQRSVGPIAPHFRNPPRSSRNKSRTEPLQKVIPRTEICWWWATPGKECRFTDEQCRDLHTNVPSTPGTNLRMGKPTWGALADYLSSGDPASTPSSNGVAQEDGSESVPLGPNGQANTGPLKSLTCWYWANDSAGCANSAEDCKYLHAKCAGGVAQKPRAWKRDPLDHYVWSESRAWTVNGSGDEDTNDDDGELVLEEVHNGDVASSATQVDNNWGNINNASGWETEVNASVLNSGWGAADTDKYKPPHIKSLEEKALIASHGW